MGRHDSWVELDVVSSVLPDVSLFSQKIVHLERLVRGLLESGERELDPAGFCGKRVEVHDCQDGLAVPINLRKGDQVTIVDLVKDDVLGPLKSSILAPNSVNRRRPSTTSFCCSSGVPDDRALTRIEWQPRYLAASTHL